MASKASYTAAQVEIGLELLRQKMEQEVFAKWFPLVLDTVRQHVPEGQQLAASKVAGIPLQQMRLAMLDLLKELPEGLPDEQNEKPDDEPGFYA